MSESVRVALWGLGAVGREAAHAVLDAPGLDLVAAKVFTDAKDGADVGTLAGRDPVGLAATASATGLLAAAPHCVVYAPRVPSVDEVCTLLRACVDVLTTAFCFHPARMPAADRDRLLAACLDGGSSLHGSGLNPGNFSAAVPLALSGLTRRLDKLSLQERADWPVYESTTITFDIMRFGQPPGLVSESASGSLAFTADLFRQQVWLLGDALRAGLEVHEVALPDQTPQVLLGPRRQKSDRIFENRTRIGMAAVTVPRRHGDPETGANSPVADRLVHGTGTQRAMLEVDYGEQDPCRNPVHMMKSRIMGRAHGATGPDVPRTPTRHRPFAI